MPRSGRSGRTAILRCMRRRPWRAKKRRILMLPRRLRRAISRRRGLQRRRRTRIRATVRPICLLMGSQRSLPILRREQRTRTLATMGAMCRMIRRRRSGRRIHRQERRIRFLGGRRRTCHRMRLNRRGSQTIRLQDRAHRVRFHRSLLRLHPVTMRQRAIRDGVRGTRRRTPMMMTRIRRS